jgi:hypothetical protein
MPAQITNIALGDDPRTFFLLTQVRQPSEDETLWLTLSAPWPYEIVSLHNSVVAGGLKAVIEIAGSQIRFAGDTVDGVPADVLPALTEWLPVDTVLPVVEIGQSLTARTNDVVTGSESYVLQLLCRRTEENV